jgi:hypothetical protein
LLHININSYYSRERIFNVNSVIEAHGRQQTLTDTQESIEHEHPEKIDDLPLTLTNTQESIEHEHPEKIDDLPLTLTAQESPATAMQKLSTNPNTTLVRIYYIHMTML